LGLDDGLTQDGTISAVDATTLKVSSELAEGVPGSPVFHGESGEFLGVLGSEMGSERTLWSGGGGSGAEFLMQRLDRPVQWSAVPIVAFLKENRIIEESDRWTRLAEAFLVVNRDEEGLDFGTEVGPGKTVGDIFEENEGLSVVQSAYDLSTWLEERGARSSAADMKKKNLSVYRGIYNGLRTQVAGMADQTFSPFNAPAAAQSLKWAKDVETRLAGYLLLLKEE
jgi:hypothetical protein